MAVWFLLEKIVVFSIICAISVCEEDLLESIKVNQENPPELNDFLTNVLEEKDEFRKIREAAKRLLKNIQRPTFNLGDSFRSNEETELYETANNDAQFEIPSFQKGYKRDAFDDTDEDFHNYDLNLKSSRVSRNSEWPVNDVYVRDDEVALEELNSYEDEGENVWGDYNVGQHRRRFRRGLDLNNYNSENGVGSSNIKVLPRSQSGVFQVPGNKYERRRGIFTKARHPKQYQEVRNWKTSTERISGSTKQFKARSTAIGSEVLWNVSQTSDILGLKSDDYFKSNSLQKYSPENNQDFTIEHSADLIQNGQQHKEAVNNRFDENSLNGIDSDIIATTTIRAKRSMKLNIIDDNNLIENIKRDDSKKALLLTIRDSETSDEHNDDVYKFPKNLKENSDISIIKESAPEILTNSPSLENQDNFKIIPISATSVNKLLRKMYHTQQENVDENYRNGNQVGIQKKITLQDLDEPTSAIEQHQLSTKPYIIKSTTTKYNAAHTPTEASKGGANDFSFTFTTESDGEKFIVQESEDMIHGKVKNKIDVEKRSTEDESKQSEEFNNNEREKKNSDSMNDGLENSLGTQNKDFYNEDRQNAVDNSENLPSAKRKLLSINEDNSALNFPEKAFFDDPKYGRLDYENGRVAGMYENKIRVKRGLPDLFGMTNDEDYTDDLPNDYNSPSKRKRADDDYTEDADFHGRKAKYEKKKKEENKVDKFIGGKIKEQEDYTINQGFKNASRIENACGDLNAENGKTRSSDEKSTEPNLNLKDKNAKDQLIEARKSSSSKHKLATHEKEMNKNTGKTESSRSNNCHNKHGSCKNGAKNCCDKSGKCTNCLNCSPNDKKIRSTSDVKDVNRCDTCKMAKMHGKNHTTSKTSYKNQNNEKASEINSEEEIKNEKKEVHDESTGIDGKSESTSRTPGAVSSFEVEQFYTKGTIIDQSPVNYEHLEQAENEKQLIDHVNSKIKHEKSDHRNFGSGTHEIEHKNNMNRYNWIVPEGSNKWKDEHMLGNSRNYVKKNDDNQLNNVEVYSEDNNSKKYKKTSHVMEENQQAHNTEDYSGSQNNQEEDIPRVHKSGEDKRMPYYYYQGPSEIVSDLNINSVGKHSGQFFPQTDELRNPFRQNLIAPPNYNSVEHTKSKYPYRQRYNTNRAHDIKTMLASSHPKFNENNFIQYAPLVARQEEPDVETLVSPLQLTLRELEKIAHEEKNHENGNLDFNANKIGSEENTNSEQIVFNQPLRIRNFVDKSLKTDRSEHKESNADNDLPQEIKRREAPEESNELTKLSILPKSVLERQIKGNRETKSDTFVTPSANKIRDVGDSFQYNERSLNEAPFEKFSKPQHQLYWKRRPVSYYESELPPEQTIQGKRSYELPYIRNKHRFHLKNPRNSHDFEEQRRNKRYINEYPANSKNPKSDEALGNPQLKQEISKNPSIVSQQDDPARRIRQKTDSKNKDKGKKMKQWINADASKQKNCEAEKEKGLNPTFGLKSISSKGNCIEQKFDADRGDKEYAQMRDALSGRLAKLLVDTVFKRVRKEPELQSRFGSGLSKQHNNKNEIKGLESFRSSETQEDIKHTEEMLRQIMNVLNKIVLDQVRRRTCKRLSPELQKYLASITRTIREKEDDESKISEEGFPLPLVKSPKSRSRTPDTPQGDFLFSNPENKSELELDEAEIRRKLKMIDELLLKYGHMSDRCKVKVEDIEMYLKQHSHMLKRMLKIIKKEQEKENTLKTKLQRRGEDYSLNREIPKYSDTLDGQFNNRDLFKPHVNLNLDKLVRDSLHKIKFDTKVNSKFDPSNSREASDVLQSNKDGYQDEDSFSEQFDENEDDRKQERKRDANEEEFENDWSVSDKFKKLVEAAENYRKKRDDAERIGKLFGHIDRRSVKNENYDTIKSTNGNSEDASRGGFEKPIIFSLDN